jgi:dihydrofolate reductase
MSTVFFHVVMSLDGYIAPDGMDLEHADDPTYKNWLARWMQLQDWTFRQQFFRSNLLLGDGGETGTDNHLLEDTYRRTGVTILGKRMFDGGERSWPEEAPFHTPVFVVTSRVRDLWPRPGGTTFYFVNDGIHSALEQAREMADGRDIRIGGGAETICQFLNAGLVDEFIVSIPPVFLGNGTRLFDNVDPGRVSVENMTTTISPRVTHQRFAVARDPDPIGA